jgi:hypothetical protein
VGWQSFLIAICHMTSSSLSLFVLDTEYMFSQM